MGRQISRNLKRKALDSCVVPSSTYGLETVPCSNKKTTTWQTTCLRGQTTRMDQEDRYCTKKGEKENERSKIIQWN